MPTSSAATEMPYTPLSGPVGSLAPSLHLPSSRRSLESSCLSMPRVLQKTYSAYHRSSPRNGGPPRSITRRQMEVETMLMRTDPFRELDRLTQQVFGTNGTLARPSVMPMDAWRDGDTFQVEFDLPGVDADSIDLDVERNVRHRQGRTPAPSQRRRAASPPNGRAGVFSRQLILGRQPRHRAHHRQLRRRRAHAADPGRRAGQTAQDRHHSNGERPAGHQRLTRARPPRGPQDPKN